MLMMIDRVAVQVWPFNMHEYEHHTASEFARKDVAGIRPPREFVGEDDEELSIIGRLFPHKIGGLAEAEALDAIRREGIPVPVQRGDGRFLGFFSIEAFHRRHTYLAADGVGQVIEFEIQMFAADKPTAADYFTSVTRTSV